MSIAAYGYGLSPGSGGGLGAITQFIEEVAVLEPLEVTVVEPVEVTVVEPVEVEVVEPVEVEVE